MKTINHSVQKLWSSNKARPQFLLILLLHLNLGVYSQGFRTAYKPQNAITCLTRFVEEISPGNYISIGHFSEWVRDSLCTQIYITGLNSSGNIIWEKKYGSPGLIYLEMDGHNRQIIKYKNHIYYAGVVKTLSGEQNGVFIKFDLNGNMVWRKFFAEPGYSTGTQIVSPARDGGFLLAGFSEGSTSMPALLIKTDGSGNLLWKKKYNKSASNLIFGRTVIQDSVTKKIIIGGYCYGNTPETIYPILLITDSIGTLIEQRIMATQQGVIADIAQMADGSFIGVGAVYHPTTSVNSYEQPYLYSLHFKFTLNSVIPDFWKQFDRPSTFNIFTTINVVNNGTEYITSGGLDTLAEHFPPYAFNTFLRLSRFDNAGSLVKNDYYNYPFFSSPNRPYFENAFYTNHLGMTSDGGMIAAIKVNNIKMSVPFYIVKWDANGCDTSLAYCMNPTGATEQRRKGPAHIYPTPATSYLMVEKQSETMQQADLVDQSGRTVRRFELSLALSKLNLTGLSQGLYLLKVYETGRETQVLKVVVE